MKNNNSTREKVLATAARLLLLVMTILLTTVIIKKIKNSDYIDSMGETQSNQSAGTSDKFKDEYSASLEKYFFQVDTTNQQIGKTESIIEYQTNLCYGIHYPVIGDKKIDAILKADVDSIISDFKNEFKNYVASNEDTRAFLSVEYESFLVGDSIASVLYKVQYDSPTYSNPVNSVRTHVFLLKTSEEITPDQIFTSDYLNLFSDKTSEYLNSDITYADSLVSKQYTDNYAPDAANFNKFILSNNGMTLYFDPYKIAKGELNTLSFTIKPDELLPYLIFNPFESVDIPQPEIPDAEVANKPFTIDSSKPMIALTFDDGPSSKVTNRILDVLEANNAHATFMVVGSRLGSEADTLVREYSLGCQIGSHSYSHKAFSSLKKKSIVKELKTTNKLLKKIIGEKASIVRTPYGEHDKSIIKGIKYPVILWNVDTKDWDSKNKKKIVKKVINNVKDGDIVIMHDIYDSTADAVEVIVPKLISQGYQLVTVSELMEAKGIKLKSGKYYYNGLK